MALRMLLLLFFAVSFLLHSLTIRGQHFELDKNRKRSSIAFEEHHNLVLIPIRINDALDLTFLLDTGVTIPLLCEPMIATVLKLEKARDVKIKGLGGADPINAVIAEGLKFSLPGISGENMRMIVLPEGAFPASQIFGTEIHGIIGYDFFRDFVVKLDYVRKQVVFTKPEHFKPGRKLERVPIQIKDKKAFVFAEVKQNLLDSGLVSGMFFIDSGSSQAVSLYHSREQMYQVPEPNIETLLGTGVSGEIHGELAKIEELRLGKSTLKSVLAAFPDEESLRHVDETDRRIGSIGADILRRFAIHIDYSSASIYIKPGRGFKSSYYYNMSGLEVHCKEGAFDQFEITYVQPGSAAAKAGLRIDDRLLKINGISTTGMQINEIYDSLNPKPGKRVKLHILRAEELRKYSFQIVDYL